MNCITDDIEQQQQPVSFGISKNLNFRNSLQISPRDTKREDERINEPDKHTIMQPNNNQYRLKQQHSAHICNMNMQEACRQPVDTD